MTSGAGTFSAECDFGFSGLRLGRPLFRTRLRCRESLLVETGNDLIAFLRGVLVALLGGEEEPLVGLGKALIDADAAYIEDRQIVLAVSNAKVGGLAEPLRRGAIVGCAGGTLGIKDRKIMHGLAVTFVGGGAIERERLRQVLLYAEAFFVKRSEPELRRHETFFCR